MSCLIPKGATYSKVENGTKILFNNVLYNIDDCQIDDEAHLIVADVKEEDAIPKKSKTKKPKPEPKDEDSNMSPRPQEPLQPTQPVQQPQPQLQVQPQPQYAPPQQQPQYAPPQQQPQYVPPQGFTVPPQFQGYLPPQQIPISETHSETQPKPDFDMNIIKQIFDLAGGNPILIVGLIAGYLGFTYLKKMDKWKEDESKNGGKHASECDNDRKTISTKITDLELKTARIDQLETKIRQVNENLGSRLNKVEEQGSISLGIDTDEIQAQIDTHSKAISNLEKKFTNLNTNPTIKKNTTTKAIKPIAPPQSDLLEDDE